MITIEDGDKPFESKKILSHSAGAIGGEDSDALVRALFEDLHFKEAADLAGIEIHPAGSFRHIAVQKYRMDGFSRTVPLTATVPLASPVPLAPPHDHLGEEIGYILPNGNGNDNVEHFEKLMRLSHEILDCHPINAKRRDSGELPGNCIWFWAEGTARKLPNFMEKYGKTGAIISAVPLCKGIGALIGLEVVHVEGATGELHTNYEGKVDAAVDALKSHDFVVIHVEAPDECTHNGDLNGKLLAIKWIDSRIVAPIVERMGDSGTDFRMLFMTDHRTLLATRGHDGGSVPYAMYDSRVDKKTGLSFNEKDAASGDYIEKGTELMGMLFNL